MNFTFTLDFVHQTGGMKRWYSQRIRQEIISGLCTAILQECKATAKARLCVGEPTENEYGKLLPIITKYLL